MIMDQRTIKIIGYVIYLICLAITFTVMIKLKLIILNGTVTLAAAAVISLILSRLLEKLIAAIGEKHKTKD